jgi:hypothetical protein
MKLNAISSFFGCPDFSILFEAGRCKPEAEKERRKGR